MYVLNPTTIDEKRLYECNGVIANWLIYEKHFPLFGRRKDGKFLFANTEELKKALDSIPFYMNITKNLW